MSTAEDILARIAANHTQVMAAANENKTQVDGLADTVAQIGTRLLHVEQVGARRVGGDGVAQSWGAQVASDPAIKALVKNRGKAQVEIRAALTSAGTAGSLVRPDRDPNLTLLPRRRMTVRQLLGQGSTSSNSVEYMRQTGFTNNAAPVAENTLKPESTLDFEMDDVKVRTIAHWIKASRQILDDAPLLRSTIDGELLYGLQYQEEMQLLAGDGTGQNLDGLIPQATAFNEALLKADDQQIDIILRGIQQAAIAELPATGIVINTNDWYEILTLKDSNGNYIFPKGPFSNAPAVLWQLPVVYTNAMPVGHFLVGAFETAAVIYDREEANVQVSTEDQDNFVKNMVTVLAEERLAMAVKRPEALIYGAF